MSTIKSQIKRLFESQLADSPYLTTKDAVEWAEKNGYNPNTARRIIGEIRGNMGIPSPNISGKSLSNFWKKHEKIETRTIYNNGNEHIQKLYEYPDKPHWKTIQKLVDNRKPWHLRFTLRLADGTIAFRNSQKMLERVDANTGQQWVNIFYDNVTDQYVSGTQGVLEIIAVALEWIDK